MYKLLFLLAALVFAACGPGYTLHKYEERDAWQRALLEAHRKALSDTTVLAAYKGGTITRADMVRYGTAHYGLESVVGSHNRTDCLLSSYNRQRLLVWEMMEKRIFLEEARKREFDRLPQIRELLEYADLRLLIPLHYQEVIAKTVVIREPAVEVAHIFLRFPQTASDIHLRIPEWAEPVRQQALALRARLLRGESFAALVNQYSQDYTKAEEGRLGWITASSMGTAYWDAVRTLPAGGISQPVLHETGVYLVKVLGHRTVTDADFRQYLHDRFAYALQEAKQKEARTRYLEGLFAAPGVLLNAALLKGGRPEAVLAAVGTWKLTLADYEPQFAAFAKGYKVDTFSPERRYTWRLRFLKEYLMAPRLLVRDAQARGLDKSPRYRAEVAGNALVRERILYRELRDHLYLTGPGDITEERIKAVYEAHKHTRYATRRPVTPEEAKGQPADRIVREGGRLFLKVAEPFDKVRQQAVTTVTRDIRDNWMADFLKRRFRETEFRFSAAKNFAVHQYTGAGK